MCDDVQIEIDNLESKHSRFLAVLTFPLHVCDFGAGLQFSAKGLNWQC